ncbi:N-acylneuraminate-9-phosphate synthase [Ferrovibrio terrae]|uniref:N-acylneuraminate-9-phosphate synthase n=1 Tax=Ferrovibrio terrae TaxID=2594003 RepID=A0A516GXP7_9PROT|nr:N-acetylneuraminate synthase family protein [Ferrovibrio terrae]QDO96314.1 N-acylneuraminate-9-phosphate synthase [Ferrovibrio terrae]
MIASQFKIDSRQVGGDAPCFVIAEAGVAHFGNYEKALQLIDLAAEAKADAVKFQIFNPEAMISKASQEWRDRLSPRALKWEDFRRLRDYCDEKGIIFFSTAHDEPSLEYLAGLNPAVFKIGSGELRNWGYLRKIASYGKPVIFSTGMHTMEDVEASLRVMTQTGNSEIAVLHCVTQYPTPPEFVNLKVLDLYRETLGGVIGYSDHTAGFHIPLAAVARGAKIIEKHISIDFNVPNAQDWKVSCGPHDLADFITQLRAVEAALGAARKTVTPGEQASIEWARKSLVAARPIRAGETITPEMLAAKRPGTGIAPDQVETVIGKVASRDIDEDAVLQWVDLRA